MCAGIVLSVENSPGISEADATISVCVSVLGLVPGEGQAKLTTVDGTAKGKRNHDVLYVQ